MHGAGYRVAVTHSPGNTKAKEWLAEHKASGREFGAFPVDVANFDSCKECIGRINQEIGPVDILVNNAGITRDTTFKKMTKSEKLCGARRRRAVANHTLLAQISTRSWTPRPPERPLELIR